MIQKTTTESKHDAHIGRLSTSQAEPWQYEIIYPHVLMMLYVHVAGIYGIYIYSTSASWKTDVFAIALTVLTHVGTSAGAHRLWSHKSYKANIYFQIFLMICYCTNYQNSLVTWIKDHRMHHKYSDTDADPHNPTRGLFFSHIGWMLVRRHPEYRKRTNLIELADIYNNPVIMFQKRYNSWLLPIVTFIVPTLIPIYFWGESFTIAWHVNILRYMVNLNIILMINSIAHKWGYKPYDRAIAPTNNALVHLVTLGDGSHNFHHVFPSDYRSEELGFKINLTKCFIEICAWMGWAYDLKIAPKELIKLRIKRTGEESSLK